MKLKLDVSMVNMLNLLVRQPQVLQMQATEKPIKQYQAKDSFCARQLISYQKWLENKVFKQIWVESEGAEKVDFDPEIHDKEDTKRFKFDFVDCETSLGKAYVDRLKEIMKHYEAIGRLSQFAEGYWKLYDALRGKEFSFDDCTEDGEDEDDVPELTEAEEKKAEADALKASEQAGEHAEGEEAA